LAKLAGVSREPAYGAARAGEQRRSVISPDRAAQGLGWQPRMSLREGLSATFEYFAKRRAAGR
jgi:UDP-glucose 4-epimerase